MGFKSNVKYIDSSKYLSDDIVFIACSGVHSLFVKKDGYIHMGKHVQLEMLLELC